MTLIGGWYPSLPLFRYRIGYSKPPLTSSLRALSARLADEGGLSK